MGWYPIGILVKIEMVRWEFATIGIQIRQITGQITLLNVNEAIINPCKMFKAESRMSALSNKKCPATYL
jgi:hypothetical protein